MPPRKSFLRQFLSPWGGFALLAAIFALICLAIWQSGARTADRLAREGAETIAEVTDIRRTSSRDSDGDIDYDYEVAYRFTVNDRVYEDRADVAYDFYAKTGHGDSLPVRYWIKDPSLSEIEPGSSSAQALFGQIATGIFGLATLVMARLGWRKARQAAWMVRHGVPRQATVSRHVNTRVEVNDQPRWRAVWHDSTGREGSTRMARLDRLPEVGSQITILIDPEGRRDSIWEGDL
ncbi:MAG: DUF3592 domain-containing protein [Tabrizicola sp.]|nr:DUF3592 domain-containing protein [Tabrizicola sp.]